MNFRKLLTVSILSVLLATGCSRVHRANTHNESDHQSIQQIAERLRLVDSLEYDLIHYVKSDTIQWAQHDVSFWYAYKYRNCQDTTLIPLTNHTRLHEHICLYDGTMLIDIVRPYNPDNEPLAYKVILPEMHRGDTIRLLIPPYLGYGLDGTEFIPPKTNIYVELTCRL